MNPLLFKSKSAAQKYVDSLKDSSFIFSVVKHNPGYRGEHWSGPEYVIEMREQGEFIGFINEF